MTIEMVTSLVSQALYCVITTSAPALLVSLVIGLIISIFQTVTSIQEQTLTFVPKVIAIFLTLIIGGNWMLNNMITLMQNLWSNFAVYTR
ncbi:MAG: flagellar biosynthesis protein FliQ [Lachnospiraceae bacterium]|nr:flagellar biosynthesis protein FliQ [Lachnospiraceae bacterium]MDE6743136.1 flagellar biosynthesis protein FliQ [Lachnospiraceae bacterium]